MSRVPGPRSSQPERDSTLRPGVLKRETSCRKGIEIKLNKCAGNDEYREKVLFNC